MPKQHTHTNLHVTIAHDVAQKTKRASSYLSWRSFFLSSPQQQQQQKVQHYPPGCVE